MTRQASISFCVVLGSALPGSADLSRLIRHKRLIVTYLVKHGKSFS